jgi:cullin-5
LSQALLKAYIAEWRKFFAQCSYLPMPFGQLETALQGKTASSMQKGRIAEDSVVRKLMLDSWNQVGDLDCLWYNFVMLNSCFQSIFSNIKDRLQSSAMKLVHNERNGEAFDSQLVIGVRESYVNLCSNTEDKLQVLQFNNYITLKCQRYWFQIYRDNFERAYINATEQFYNVKAPEYLSENGVQAYMRYQLHSIAPLCIVNPRPFI